MKKVLFIDRDGTIIAEPHDFKVNSFTKLKLLRGVVTSLARIAKETDFELVMVSNQDGLGTYDLPEESFYPVHDLLMDILEGEGIFFKAVHIDNSYEEQNKPTRKPGTGMLTRYFEDDYDLCNSFVIGDRPTDVLLARNLGAGAIFLKNPNFPPPVNFDVDLLADDWQQIYEFLRLRPRSVTHRRKTNETEVFVDLDPDGIGRADISTGIPFFDHMLEQVAHHGGMDLTITAIGDVHIDEHHTVEDVAITLGQAFSMSLNNKRGMERYGYCLPMDDCLAQVAVDFGGRNWIVWDAEFKREMIGQMPTELFFHFFKSFTDHAKCNLNVRASGENEHHKIESIFKAFARSSKMALRRDPGNWQVPSTKGAA